MAKKKSFFSKKSKTFLFLALFALINLLLVLFLFKEIILLTVLLFCLAFSILFYYKDLKLNKFFVSAAITGAFLESLSIYFGIWQYNYSNLVNIPSWLVPLWGNVAIYSYVKTKLLVGKE